MKTERSETDRSGGNSNYGTFLRVTTPTPETKRQHGQRLIPPPRAHCPQGHSSTVIPFFKTFFPICALCILPRLACSNAPLIAAHAKSHSPLENRPPLHIRSRLLQHIMWVGASLPVSTPSLKLAYILYTRRFTHIYIYIHVSILAYCLAQVIAPLSSSNSLLPHSRFSST